MTKEKKKLLAQIKHLPKECSRDILSTVVKKAKYLSKEGKSSWVKEVKLGLAGKGEEYEKTYPLKRQKVI